MVICDNQSSPEYTHAPCVGDSDTNVFDSPDPEFTKMDPPHTGGAYLELQFYPPGWYGACSPYGLVVHYDTQWCAGLTITSLNVNELTNTDNNETCLDSVGDEPQDFAYLTYGGKAASPADPRDFAKPFDPKVELAMNPGDRIEVNIHDTSKGVVSVVQDITNGLRGSMTASIANGFAQVLFQPNSHTCHVIPYAFHPMYSTSTVDTKNEWGAHNGNMRFADEIGHFEYYRRSNASTDECTWDRARPTPGGTRTRGTAAAIGSDRSPNRRVHCRRHRLRWPFLPQSVAGAADKTSACIRADPLYLSDVQRQYPIRRDRGSRNRSRHVGA